MATRPERPLLQVVPENDRARALGSSGFPRPPEPAEVGDQRRKFGPKFERLREVLERDNAGLELRADPDDIAPERLLVFELKGSVSDFARAISKVRGLELIDEEELPEDEDKAPALYLMVPDARALSSIVSMWRRWQSGQAVDDGFKPWEHAFGLLREIRAWNAADRITAEDRRFLEDELEDADSNTMLNLEVELVFRTAPADRDAEEVALRQGVEHVGGDVVSVSCIPEIAYHAALTRLPAAQVRELLALRGISAIDAVMHFRPQSVATSISIEDVEPSATAPAAVPTREPILAVLDGYPVASHPLLRNRIEVEDVFGLERDALVANRVHGTAMASLIIHGDRHRGEEPLPRLIHFVPVIRSREGRERFPESMLVVDMVYRAILAMRGDDGSAPNVLIVNLSLGNCRRPFANRMSPWARILDRLAYTYGILFVVSAGNQTAPFTIGDISTRTNFEDALPADRATKVKRAIGAIARNRRIISPAETVNGLTVGACNDDAVSDEARRLARVNIDPYGRIKTANPSSSLGPGFGNATKPDVLMGGAREHLTVISSGEGILVTPCGAGRQHGLKVAAPPRQGQEDYEGFTDGTSAAAALVSRTAHRIHDALQGEYGEAFLALPKLQRAVLLKALIVHGAEWPEDGAELIKATLGPANNRQHVLQKDNIRRFLGFGVVDPNLAVSCTTDRATFWATGLLAVNRAQTVSIPIPQVLSGKSRPHHMRATLAWFTPVLPGLRTYRAVRLRVLDPDDIATLRVDPAKGQPDGNQTARGTVFTRCWEGDRAPVLRDDMFADVVIQRQPHQGAAIDEPVAYGLAVTIAMPGVSQVYEQARQQLEARAQARARPRPR